MQGELSTLGTLLAVGSTSCDPWPNHRCPCPWDEDLVHGSETPRSSWELAVGVEANPDPKPRLGVNGAGGLS